MFYKVYHEIKENFAKNNGQDAQCHFIICKPYVKQKGSRNSQMPCQDRLLFSLKYKKLEILLSGYIQEQKAVCSGFLELELITGKY